MPQTARDISGTGRQPVCINCWNAETIYERVKHDTTRPLLQGDDPQTKIRMLLVQRDGYYRDAADVVINVDGKDFEQVLGEIEEQVD